MTPSPLRGTPPSQGENRCLDPTSDQRASSPPDKEGLGEVKVNYQNPHVKYSRTVRHSWHTIRHTDGKINAMIRYSLSYPFVSFLFISSALAQHTVIMKDGTQKKGEVRSISGPTMTMINHARPLEMLISDVRTIHFYDSDIKDALPAINSRKSFKGGFDVVEYVMEGRTMVSFPKIGLGTKDNGVVVVDVTIDKYGNVLSADPGAPGSKTTDDKYLFVKAQAACQQAKFNNDPTAPLSTTGKVFVIFP